MYYSCCWGMITEKQYFPCLAVHQIMLFISVMIAKIKKIKGQLGWYRNLVGATSLFTIIYKTPKVMQLKCFLLKLID